MKFPQWIGLAAITASCLLLWSLRDVLILLFASIVLAMALCTLVGSLRERWPMPRPLALLVCLFGVVLVVGIGLAVLVPPFINQFNQLLMQLPAAAFELKQIAISTINQISGMVYGLQGASDWSARLLSNGQAIPDGATLASGLSGGLEKLLGLAGNLGAGLVQLLFVVAVTLMVAVQPNAYREVAIQLMPSFYRRRANQILTLCGEALNSWMVGVGISSLAVFLLCWITLSLLGVKLVLANALLAGVLNLIPNVGPTMSTVFPMAVALLDAPWKAAAVLGAYVVIQNLESYVITPSVMHHQVKLLPGLTLAAQVLFTVVFGPLGLLMALPLAVVMQVLIAEVLIKDVLNRWSTVRLRT